MAVEMVKAADIPDAAFLAAVEDVHARERRWALIWDLTEVLDFPVKVILAKAKRLIRRGVLEGCACGCRGDFEIPGWRDRYSKTREESRAELFAIAAAFAQLRESFGVSDRT